MSMNDRACLTCSMVPTVTMKFVDYTFKAFMFSFFFHSSD